MGPLFEAKKKLEAKGHHMSEWDDHDDKTATASCLDCGKTATTTTSGKQLIVGPAADHLCRGKKHPDAVEDPQPGALSEER